MALTSGRCMRSCAKWWTSGSSSMNLKAGLFLRQHLSAKSKRSCRFAAVSIPMDAALIEELITKNKPLKIETASGQVFEVPHRDFVSFSTRKTSLIVSYEENGTEHFAIVPLLTIADAMAPA